LLKVQNQALIKTAMERAVRIEELERELQILRARAEQTDKGDRELQTLRETVEHQTDKLGRELETFRKAVEQANNKVERELQQARSEIERLTLERDFYSKKTAALEEENRQLTESATKHSVHAQTLERDSPIRPPNTPSGVKSWNANSTGLIRMVRLRAGSTHRTNPSHARGVLRPCLFFPPPALGERRHRGLARRLIAVRWCAVWWWLMPSGGVSAPPGQRAVAQQVALVAQGRRHPRGIRSRARLLSSFRFPRISLQFIKPTGYRRSRRQWTRSTGRVFVTEFVP
jgi:hypothetical protein